MLDWIKKHKTALLITFGGLLLVMAVLYQRCGFAGCPDVEKLNGYMPDEASTIVDHRGEEIGKLFLTRRTVVPLDTLPKYVPAAFIAMEDRRFYEHKGVDWRRVFGAAYRNVRSLGIEEGSSTITMQLARNVFPDKLPAHKKTLFRKIAEAKVARAIEKQFSKEDILQMYLNQIYFGQGAWGIEAAAQEYFGKPSAKLTLSEAAILAALPRAPSKLNPRTNRDLALQGRKLVLERMVEEEMISTAEAEEATKAKLRLRHGKLKTNDPAPYFVEAVRNILEHELGDAIYSDGYKIYTTLDGDLQRTLEQELSKQLAAIERGAYGGFRHQTLAAARADTTDDEAGTKYLQAAAIFMDTRSGDIRALIGGRNYEDSEFNRALQAKRQPGSAFKPFVYAAAFDQGYSPTHRLMDRPLRLVIDRRNVWEPKNYDGTYADVVTMRQALTQSRNVPTVRLATEIGITRVIDMARQMGLGGRIPSVPSVVLGSAEVTPIEMTAAYAAFANLGDRPEPRFVTKVVDRNNNVVWSSEVNRQRVIEPATAFLTTSLMQDVVDRGTATAVRAAGYTQPAAGKTGTTNDAADIWFIGFTPDIVGTIWMGFDKRKTIVARATGGELAAPVWGRVMRRMNMRSGGWAPPPGIEMRMVDEYGNAVGENCPMVGQMRQEYFREGSVPIASCYSGSTYGYLDTMGYYPDTVIRAPREDDGWWRRMRSRIFGREGEETAVQPAPEEPKPKEKLLGTPVTTTPPPPNPNPNPAPPPTPTPNPKPDTLPKPKPDTLLFQLN
ncbi:MAG TPA: PBP1A family penicillin-binding protein [Longimicrobiales bacterium]